MNQSFITGGNSPTGVAVGSDFIYWANRDTGTIGRASLDGTGVNHSFMTPGTNLMALAVNSSFLYWTSNNTGQIGRSNLDGTGENGSFINAAVGPWGLAVDAGVSPPAAAPTVTTDEATNVTATGAALNSTINAGAEGTTYKYEYGPTTAFGTVVPASATLSAGSGSSPVSQPPQTITGLSPGTTYYYRVCANNSVTGPGVANQVCGAVRAFTTSGSSAPSVSTGAASAVTGTTAQVSGSVNARGAATAYVFEYGTTTSFGSISTVQSAGSGTTDLPVNATLSGLQPGTTYVYRLVATNSQGTTSGTVTSFTTPPASAPAVTTGDASNIGQRGATLSGTVDPEGQTAYTFEYGTTTSFGQITSVAGAGDSGGPQQVSLPVSGLAANTTYLYRIVATNSVGSSTGPVKSFTTATLRPIYFADVNGIGRAGDDGSLQPGTIVPFSGGATPSGVAVDSSHIYWTSSTDSIGRSNLDGTGANHSFITGTSNAFGLVVDSNHIYWANGGSGSIGRANLDGAGVNQSFITGAASPFGVAVDSGHLYWINRCGALRSVARANLDGTGVNQNFISPGTTPFGLAVDSGHVYWAAPFLNRIGRANLDGSGANNNFITTAGSPVGVAVPPSS